MMKINRFKRKIESVLGNKITQDDLNWIFELVNSLVIDSDKKVEKLKKRLKHYEQPRRVESQIIIGALKDTINKHGPITSELKSSAAKRIQSQFRP